ncbi:MFS transporter [Bacillus sp. CLL-7-23]|uniref:MFS transporter n=1 Tax=Bacillus changyiensis TaxID=3004103 RepID=A0ABT4X2H7_9BACI|nr:MFS transporter [Bacillus changyiensis]MDA7026446.1 MFS transporter [Bacillus changyiensis]
MNPYFYLLWSSQTIEAFGRQITIIALPLIAINQLNTTNFVVTLISFLTFLPNLLLGFHAGALVDRWNKKRVMLFCQLTSACLLLMIPLSFITGFLSIDIILAIAFLSGCCSIFQHISYSSYLPEIIPSQSLLKGNAKLEVTNGAAQVAGPGLGGYLIQMLTAPIAILLDAVSFLISFIFTLFLPDNSLKDQDLSKKQSIWKDIGEGIIYTWKHRILRPILISYSFSVLFIGLYQSISVIYMTRSLHLSTSEIGIVLGLGNAGFIIGALISRKLAEKLGVGRVIISSLGLFSIAFLMIGSVPDLPHKIYLLLFGQFILSLGVPIYNVNLVSLRQAIIPYHLLGRVQSVSKVFGRGLVPVGAILGGILASLVEVRFAVILAGIGCLLSVLPALFSEDRLLYLKTHEVY